MIRTLASGAPAAPLVRWARLARACLADDRGQALVEYALIVALLSVACMGGFHLVTQAATNNLSNTSTNLANTSANPPS